MGRSNDAGSGVKRWDSNESQPGRSNGEGDLTEEAKGRTIPYKPYVGDGITVGRTLRTGAMEDNEWEPK